MSTLRACIHEPVDEAKPARPRPDRLLGGMALVGSGLLLLFWICYLSGVLDLAGGGEAVKEFEAAFPVADGFLIATLVAAGVGLRRGRRYGRFAMVAAASMTLYLGIGTTVDEEGRPGLTPEWVAEVVLAGLRRRP